MFDDEITPMDAVQMLVKFSEQMQEQFDKVNERFDTFNERFDKLEEKLDNRFNLVDQRLGTLEIRVGTIEKHMVTQTQFKSLVGILREKGVFSEFDAAHVLYRGA